jgi:hypothetical protein
MLGWVRDVGLGSRHWVGFETLGWVREVGVGTVGFEGSWLGSTHSPCDDIVLHPKLIDQHCIRSAHANNMC